MGGEQWIVTAQPRRPEPAERNQEQAREHHRSPTPRLPPGTTPNRQPGAERDGVGPPLGPDQRGGDQQPERRTAAAVEQPVDRPQGAGDEGRLRGAAHEVVAVVLGGEQTADRDRARHPAPAPRAQPRRQAPGRHPAEQPADPCGDHPQRRCRAPEQGVDDREAERKRLPRRTAPDVERQVRHDDLPAPHDPGERVIAGDGREGRPGEHGKRDAGDHPVARRGLRKPDHRVGRRAMGGAVLHGIRTVRMVAWTTAP